MLRRWKQKTVSAGRRLFGPVSEGGVGRPRRSARWAFERLEPRLVLDAGPLVISEFMADNETTLADRDGVFSDWIEIHNPTDVTQSLDGWCLTDDEDTPAKWRFPDVDLMPGEYRVVFASGKNLTDPAEELHTNFSLDADGEYLALIQPDGVTVQQEFAPEFPVQADDVSYGLFQNTVTLLSGDEPVRYRVPTADDDPAAWTSPEFDDAGWSQSGTEPTILVTEIGVGAPDYIEVQNVSGHVVDTSGWVVALNRGTTGDVNQVHDTLWQLPASMAPGEVLYRTDLPGEHYFGENIAWGTGGTGWAAIVDDSGQVADFVPWRYANEQIAEMRAVVNGFTIHGPSGFTGDGVVADDGNTTMQRSGRLDHDDATDFAFASSSSTNRGQQNLGVTLPVLEGRITGIGFSGDDLPGFGGALQGNPASKMLDQNGSLWTRIAFEVDDPDKLETLSLWMQYNDGLTAYLNGEEVAARNAPDQPAWNATATAERSVADSIVPEEIRITGSLDALRPGRNVLAIHGMNVTADDPNFLLHAKLLATHVDPAERYLATPTPREPNKDPFLGYVADTKFSADRGFYDEPFQVEIATATPGATIYYTTDGSVPSETHGQTYTDPITISETTVLRALAVKEGYRHWKPDTQTYLFPEDVARQAVMSKTITDSVQWGERMRESLLAVPTISLVTPNTLSVAEVETSVEMIFPDGNSGFQVDAGIEHFGGHSLNNYPKKSMRISFKREYGPKRLQFDLFGDDAVDDFDQILLRAGSHDTPFYINGAEAGAGGMYLRNRWIMDKQMEMGQPAPHGRFIHVYINGTYWGQYHLMERPNAAFMASYFGGDKEDYDALNAGTPVDGDVVAWNAMAAATGNYQTLQQYMDVENFADYMLSQFYCGNDWDWNHRQNWMAARRREPGAGYQFFAWDSDMILRRSVGANVISRGGPGNLWASVSRHAEFKILLADRAQKYFFNGGLLTPERVRDDFELLADRIESSVIAETARWGTRGAYANYTPSTWRTNLDTVLRQLVDRRTDIVVQQLRAAGFFPNIDAPVFHINGSYQHGGRIDAGDVLSIASPGGNGTVYYTLDGSDPRLTGGAVSETALVFDGMPIALDATVRVKARVLNGETWSALNEADFFVTVPADASNLVITELNYNPYDPTDEEIAVVGAEVDDDAFEFLELRNVADMNIDLAGVRFERGLTFEFPAALLAPGESIVIVADVDAFTARYGDGVRIAGSYEGRLSNGGERILLVDRFGEPIVDFEYNDTGKWPGRADGSGSSLEVVDTAGDYSDADNWRSSSEFGGSPGVEGVGPIHDVVVNEVLSHSGLDGMDRIELLNTTDHEIDLSGWYLSDSNDNFQKYRIPEGTILTAGAYRVFDEDDFNPSGGLDPLQHPNDFALNGPHGDDVWLLAADATGRLTHFIDHAEFPAAALGETFGRWPNGTGRLVPMAEVTIGDENTGPRVGPIVLSEVHYNAVDADPNDIVSGSDLEFVELYNPTGAVVDLTGWRIRGGIDFEFTDGTMLPSQGTLVVVPFELTDTTRLTQFRTDYGIDASVALVGGYRNKLDNGGDRVQLQRPSISPPDEPDYTPHLIEDEVIYDDLPPWPAEADGQGMSLHRTSIDAWGHAATSWVAQGPTPGEALFWQTSADFDGDGDMDVDDIDALTLVGNLAVGVAVPEADAKFDVNADGIVNTADLDQWLAVAAVFNGFGSPYLRGDANLDGNVDIWAADGSGDAQVLNSNLGTAEGMAWSNGDFNGDGDVDIMQLDGSGDAQWLSENLGERLDRVIESLDVPNDRLRRRNRQLYWLEAFHSVDHDGKY